MQRHTSSEKDIHPRRYFTRRQKIELYNRYGWGRNKNWNIDLLEWYNECFLKWTPANRKEIDSKYPIWTGDINSHTLPFEGSHPKVMIEYIVKRSVINNSTPNPQRIMQHVITAVDGIEVSAVEDLVAYLNDKEPGDKISLSVHRGGDYFTVEVTLGEWPEKL